MAGKGSQVLNTWVCVKPGKQKLDLSHHSGSPPSHPKYITPLSLPIHHLHQAELQMAQEENHRLNLELQEAKGRQEEQSAQAQRLKDKVAQMKDTLGQAQQRVVSEALRQQEIEKVPRAHYRKVWGKRQGWRWSSANLEPRGSGGLQGAWLPLWLTRISLGTLTPCSLVCGGRTGAPEGAASRSPGARSLKPAESRPSRGGAGQRSGSQGPHNGRAPPQSPGSGRSQRQAG